MSQQNLDLRKSIRVVRQRKKLFGGAAAVGLLVGAAYAVLTPPQTSSTALVVVSGNPASLSNSQNSAANSQVDTSLATQIVIASSDPVIAAALPHVNPPTTSLQAVDSRISVTAVGTSDVLSIAVTGQNSSQTEDTANAVANSYVAYVNASTNSAVHVVAKVLEPATTASGGKLPQHVGVYAILGAFAGAVLGFVICLALGRSDRRLARRDEIANSIAAPVLLSIPVERPADPRGWATLLNEYEPDAVDAYGLRNLLQQFGVGTRDANGKPTSLTVLSLASDPAALALGPQLAAFASAHGIPTALVVGSQQDMNVIATLHTACAAGEQAMTSRGKPLRLLVTEDGQVGQLGAAFTVIVLVIDGRDPQIPATVRTNATVLGVSSGGVTAEELALAATAAAEDGRDIVGILVANPDPDDQTTGRIPRLARVLRPLPTRVNGLATEIRR
jgi:capsular polysaccharide biosynthesis protein